MMAYDPVDGYYVLFGGFNQSGAVDNDTWAFEGGRWVELHPTTSPPVLFDASMAWDPVDGYLLLFGGSGPAFYARNGTWVFAAGEWTLLHPPRTPSPRYAATMTWDAVDGYIVLFGGDHSGFLLNDTWTFVGGNWTNISSSDAPSQRRDASMAFDAADGYVVLFGGRNDTLLGVVYNDTWRFSAGAWQELPAITAPTPKFGAEMTYYPPARALLLFGGAYGNAYTNQTWWFRASVWSNGSGHGSPPSLGLGAIASGPPDQLLIFGGFHGIFSVLNVTWMYYSLNLTVAASPATDEPPVPVEFNATVSAGTSPVTVDWSFGDGFNATGAAATHVYGEGGNYTVFVHAFDGLGVASFLNFTIQVLPKLLVSSAAAPLSGTAPLNVTFNASAEAGAPPYSFVWKATSDVTLSNPSISYTYPTSGTYIESEAVNYAYSTAGTYSASLTVNDSFGVVVEHNFTIQVEPAIPPSPTFTLSASVNRTEGEAPFAVQLNASVSGGTSPYALTWTFGDGLTSTQAAPTSVYSSPGRYVVGLSATDASGDSASAPNVTIDVLAHVSIASGVHVYSGHDPLVEEFMATPSDGVPPYALIWTFGDGSTGSGASTSHTYPAGGSYNVSVEVIDALGDTAQGSIPVSIAPAPSAASPAWYSSATSWEIFGGAIGGLVIGVAVTWLFGRRGGRHATEPHGTSGPS